MMFLSCDSVFRMEWGCDLIFPTLRPHNWWNWLSIDGFIQAQHESLGHFSSKTQLYLVDKHICWFDETTEGFFEQRLKNVSVHSSSVGEMILKVCFQNVSLTPAKWTRLLNKYISQITTAVSCELDWSRPKSMLDLLAPYDCPDPSAHQWRLVLCMPCLKILGHVDFPGKSYCILWTAMCI